MQVRHSVILTMVQLPKVAFPEAVEPRVVLYHDYNYRLYLLHGPPRLELEKLADASASYTSSSSTSGTSLRQIAMNRLREVYNLEFKLRCEKCGCTRTR